MRRMQAEPASVGYTVGDQLNSNACTLWGLAPHGPARRRSFARATLFATLVVLVFSRGAALATEYNEYAKLEASDATASANFGNSVSIDGNVMVVGAPGDNDGFGAAYVYALNGGVWSEEAKLTASDGSAFDYFGQSVFISGDTIVVGAWDDDGATGSGYVFLKPGGGWSGALNETAKLTASDAATMDRLGFTVSISGNTIVLGAPTDDCAAGNDCGSAYVFVRPGGGWTDLTETAKLTASDAAAADVFAESVSISGDTIVVSAGVRQSAFVFVKPGGGWSGSLNETATLTASDAAPGDAFGASVAINGDTIAVGAQGDDCVAGNCGAAYVFVRPGGGWSNATETAKLTADAPASDQLGRTISIGEDIIVAGAPVADCAGGNTCGAAYTFIKPGGGWANSTETARLTASDAANGDSLEASVAVSGSTIVMGAGHADCGAGMDCGSAYVFHSQPILYVNRSAAGLNNGTSWANAFRYLQDALAAAAPGTEVWVARGTYKPDRGAGITLGDRTATFQLQSGVALYGSFAGTETLLSQRNIAANTSILSGDLLDNDGPNFTNYDENSFHVVSADGVDSTAILDGFRITAGYANGSNVNEAGAGLLATKGASLAVRYCHFFRNATRETEGGSGADGAGALIVNSSPLFQNCKFEGNRALFNGNGGGTTCTGSSPLPPEFEDCLFVNNSAVDGGGMNNNSGCNPILRRCTFSGNSASYGGGMLNNASNPAIVSSTFQENSAAVSGGGLYNDVSSSPTIMNCAFLGNVALSVGGGGLVNGNSSNPVIANCIFSGNSAAGGGAMSNAGNSSPTVTNTTFSSNSASANGGGVFNAMAGVNSPALRNCIFWGNSDPGGMDESAQIYTESGSPTVNYSIIQGGWSGSGGNNLSGDPLFFDPDGADNIIGTLDDDPSLRAGSPAIDAGDSTALPLDTFDLDGDLNTAERMPIDLAGNARQFDDPSTPDTGVPGSPVVDMGAYEYFTDCNGNGVEDSVDISQSTSEDCDWDGGGPNGTPDECDIAACPERTCFGGVYNGAPCEVDAECVAGVCGNQAAAACADCNLNDAPDGCDIDLGSSLDVAPMDGVPDECVNFTAGCNPPSNEWSCGGNWTLGGDYPDNDTVSYSVVLNGTADAVCLDVTVDIDSLDIVHGASLQVTEPDPPCDGASANRGPSGTNLDVVTDAGVSVLDSSLTVAGDNAINVLNGPLTIGPGGSYSLDPGATLVSSAVLSVSELFIIGSDCYAEPCSHGGQLVLVDSMEVSTSGDLVLDGTLANGDCELTRGATLAARSFHAPPIKHVGDSSIIFVGGNVVYAGAANVVYESTEPMVVAGDFANNSVRPDCFDYLNGAIRLEGTSPQTFEAAGRDIGPVDSIADAEFAIADITIASGSQVTFRDNFDNDLSSQASCSEAQYVGTLTLEAGAAATFANCRVYYETLQRHPSATVSFTGCGELRSIANPLATLVEPSPTPKNRFISFVVPTGGAPEDTAIRVRLRSLHHPAGPPNAPNLSAFEGQYRYLNAIRDGGNNPVFTCPDSAAFNTNFRCATLGCAPEYRDWAGIFGGAAVHVTDDSLVPSSQYEVAQIAGSCAGNEANCTAISTGLAVATERWGNVDNTPSGGAPSAIDIGFIVSKVKDAPGAFTKPRCQLQGATPNPYGLAVSALDIGRGVDAVKGQPYPFTISACP